MPIKGLLTAWVLRRSLQDQTGSGLRNLGLWGLLKNEHGHIAIGNVDVLDILQRFGTPLLVVNGRKLKEDAADILNAMKPAPSGSQTLYSYKTNCTPGILQEIHGLGIGAEVISPYELWLAERLGLSGERMLYNGVDKNEESIERAIRLNVLSINIDHMEEIQRIHEIARRMNRKVRVGVRLGLVPSSQFGMELESGEALEACRRVAGLRDTLALCCIHFNVTSNARSAWLHKSFAKKAVEFMASVKRETGIDIDYLDIGGGFGVPTTKNMSSIEYAIYRSLGILPKPPNPADFQSIGSFLGEILGCIGDECRARQLDMPKILIEPGRFITSRAELLLAKVLTVKHKKNGTRFAITNAGRLSITYPLDFEYHEVFLADRPNAKLDTNFNIMGRICTSADWMLKNRFLPRLKPGDILAVMDAGAYFSSYSSNFAFQRPPIIWVENGSTRILRNEETFDHLVDMDEF
jgi:diaminopimelate decarboxylase